MTNEMPRADEQGHSLPLSVALWRPAPRAAVLPPLVVNLRESWDDREWLPTTATRDGHAAGDRGDGRDPAP